MIPEINLLPWRAQQRTERWRRIIFLVVGVALILTGGIAWFEILNPAVSIATTAPIVHANLSFQQVKFVGYVQENKRTWGLLLFPNGETKEVQVGTMLSSLGAWVASINEKQLILVFANKHRRVLAMGN
jgi:hypothetical protein